MVKCSFTKKTKSRRLTGSVAEELYKSNKLNTKFFCENQFKNNEKYIY